MSEIFITNFILSKNILFYYNANSNSSLLTQLIKHLYLAGELRIKSTERMNKTVTYLSLLPFIPFGKMVLVYQTYTQGRKTV